MTKHKTIIHPLEPYHDAHSKVLILGSFPSVKTRESQFFYGHPQNRFWPLMAELLHDAQPESVEEKRDFLAKHHIACWDVIYQCDIIGSRTAAFAMWCLLISLPSWQKHLFKRYLSTVVQQSAIISGFIKSVEKAMYSPS